MKPSILGFSTVLYLAVRASAQDGQSPSDLENYWAYGHSESVPDTRKLFLSFFLFLLFKIPTLRL